MNTVAGMIEVTVAKAKEMFLGLKESKTGHLVAVHFMRVSPKCEECGKTYDKETADVDCPECGGVVHFDADDVIRFGVQNPGEGITKPGTGIRKGKDFFQALEEDNCIKYYSFTRNDRTDGKRGAYRQFKLENLVDFTMEGKKYILRG